MTIRVIHKHGTRRLLIDITFKQSDGTKRRFRRVSSAVSVAAARDEERAIRDRIARTGAPYEPALVETPQLSFRQVVGEYRREFMPANLKPSTRRGYNSVINTHLLPLLGDKPAVDVSGRCAQELDTALGRQQGRKTAARARTTRNNVQIVLRSILRFAEQRGYIPRGPTGLPALKRTGQLVDHIPTDAEVRCLLGAASVSQRRFFLLVAYAGLRPNEVRALRGRHVRWEGADEARRGTLLVREGLSAGELATPKTGPRKVPILGPLRDELKTPPVGEKYIASTAGGETWSEWAPNQAFKRVCKRLNLSEEYTLYSLRHWAITSWLRAGIPVHVVQRMAGHKHLSTTQRYVHFIDADLDTAVAIYGNYGATAAE